MSKKKILIVEDEESLLKLESILLTSRGYDVCSVSNGKAALESLDKEKPDLVLLDVMLPEVDVARLRLTPLRDIFRSSC